MSTRLGGQARDLEKAIQVESDLRTVAVTKFWHALAGLYM